jgi:hypothetical protein
VALVSEAYPPGKDPTELMDTTSFPTTSSIEDHLLDRILPSAYLAGRGDAARYSLDARPTGVSAIFLAVIALTFLLVFHLLTSPQSQLVAVLIAALGIGIGLVTNFPMSAQNTDLAAPTPQASLRNDALAWGVFGLGLGIGVALICGFAFQTEFAASFAWVGLGLATALAASHASAYVLAIVVMVLARRGPVRLLAFLEDARRRQILRRVGWVYQFRHARLQDRMAKRYRR